METGVDHGCFFAICSVSAFSFCIGIGGVSVQQGKESGNFNKNIIFFILWYVVKRKFEFAGREVSNKISWILIQSFPRSRFCFCSFIIYGSTRAYV